MIKNSTKITFIKKIDILNTSYKIFEEQLNKLIVYQQLKCKCELCGTIVIKPSRAFRLKSIMMCPNCRSTHKNLKEDATINKT